MSRELELSAAYARLVLQSEANTPEALLSGTGLSSSDIAELEFVDAAVLATIFRNYAACMPDNSWTAKLGAIFNIAAHGALGFAALSAPTLGQAMDVMGTLTPSRNTATKARTYATDKYYVIEFSDRTGDNQFGDWMAEIILKIVETLVATIIGHPVGKNVLVSLAHEPAGDTDPLVQAFDATVQFNSEVSSLSVPLAWRRLPSPLHDESIYRTNVIKCRELIAQREQAGSVAYAVRNLLSNYFDAHTLGEQQAPAPPSLEQAAESLHLTPRTLIRRLQGEGTAYKDILQSLRKDYAQRLLADARLNVAEVGEILGYSDQANFGRAFKRWFDVSPASWRRHRPG